MIEFYQHCVFVCSNYTSRTRTGLHFLYNDSNIENVLEIVRKYTSKRGVAFYFVNTNEPTIESIKHKDAFFKTINILEGDKGENVATFNNAINNQITAADVALLLLCRQRMTVKEIKTALFYIYCVYARENGKFPFPEKLFFDPKEERGFKIINASFSNVPMDGYSLECTKPDVIMSKFFNCEGGVELMNSILELFYRINQIGIKKLESDIDYYFKKCQRIYHLDDRDSRYAFTLSKKTINKLKISIE